MRNISTAHSCYRHNCSTSLHFTIRLHFNITVRVMNFSTTKGTSNFKNCIIRVNNFPWSPQLPSLLLFVRSCVSPSDHCPFPKQLSCWCPTPDVAALLAHVPPTSTGLLSSPWRHTAVSGSTCLLSYTRFPHKLSIFQECPGMPVNCVWRGHFIWTASNCLFVHLKQGRC